jgi:hypothetical protein
MKRPLTPTIESIALERKWNLEMGVLTRSEIVDAGSPVLPSGQLRAEQPTKPTVFGVVRIQIEGVRFFDRVGQLEDHLFADWKPIRD